RFFTTARELSDEQAREFAQVDYYNRMAIVGSINENGREQLIVSARYNLISPAERPGEAEAAIVVRDDFQNRGLGKTVMAYLARYAREHGVKAFIATVHVANARVMHFIDISGLSYTKKVLEPGVWELTIHLARQPFEGPPPLA
ncbi:MAG: N-acetyltransferase family protein, partial [Chloroflexota bacterium]